jgi:hypothetical protein
MKINLRVFVFAFLSLAFFTAIRFALPSINFAQAVVQVF